MNHQQYYAIMKTLEKITPDRPEPRMTGTLGRFLKGYRSCITDYPKIAINEGMDWNRQGEIPGYSFGTISLIPFGRLIQPQSFENNFSVYVYLPVICPELLCITNLRLDVKTASGAAAHDVLKQLMPDEGETGITMTGGFRWKPPDRITPGTAQCDALTGFEEDSWATVNFLKYCGEDLTSDPYPTDYRRLEIGDERLFAAIRVVAGVVLDGDSLVVPYANSVDSITIHPKVVPCTSQRASMLLSSGGIGTYLLIQEPQDEHWSVWDAVESSANDLLAHLVSWARYVDWLKPDSVTRNDEEIIEMATASLLRLNINASTSRSELPLMVNQHQFAAAFARHNRYNFGKGLNQVGYLK